MRERMKLKWQGVDIELTLPEKEAGYCKDCYWFDFSVCENHAKLNGDLSTGVSSDEMVYSHSSDGLFLVGENFGCIHFKKDD